jgi:ATP-dependent Zn protease
MIETILSQLQNNQMLTTGVSVWALSVIAIICKSVPGWISQKIEALATKDLEIGIDVPDSYSASLSLVTKKCKRVFGNTWQPDRTDRTKVVVGQSSSWFYYPALGIFKVRLESSNNPLTEKPFRKVNYTFMGFTSRKIHLFNDMVVKHHAENTGRSDKIAVTKYEGYMDSNENQYINKITPTDMIFPQREKIFGIVDTFLKSQSQYVQSGRTYKTGIILYGKPGTGKTTMIKMIASHFDLPIATADLRNLHPTHNLNVVRPTLLVVEDIDHGLEAFENDEKGSKNFSDLLNFFDGITSPENCIFIATTNHLEKLMVHSGSLIRPGRFDHLIEIERFYAKENV